MYTWKISKLKAVPTGAGMDGTGQGVSKLELSCSSFFKV